jgi:inner membrane protein
VASLVTHTICGVALAAPFVAAGSPRRLLWLAPLAACIPDLDVAAFRLGIPYAHPLGHRGFSHAILFAALLALVLVRLCFGDGTRKGSGRVLFSALFLAGLSHGLLDALTDGGLGVGFFIPFWNERFFFPVRPLAVSPLRLKAFLTLRGIEILRTEILWVWLPSIVLGLGSWMLRRRPEAGASSPYR